MAEQKLNVINKSVDLIEYTFAMTSNKKRYTPKHRALIEKMQNISMEIFDFLIEANAEDINVFKNERLRNQTKAITYCDKLSKFVELSLKLNLIGSDIVENWQSLICDVKYMTIKWREVDKKR